MANKPFPNKRFVGHGDKNYFWNGGYTYTSTGYKMIWKPNHPLRNMRGYVAEHRLAMEKHIGRHLRRTEVVHHINKDVQDNRIENLKLYRNNSEHMRDHYANK